MTPIPDHSHAKLNAIRELDDVINSHLRWVNLVNRSLICGTHAAEDDVADGDRAYRSCAFDAWYYKLESKSDGLWSEPLKQIAVMHKRMHSAADGLLRSGEAAARVAVYDTFCRTAYRFKTTVRSLQFKLIREVCLVDHLTGAWNRSSLFQKISEEHDRMLRHGDSCCLCMMDLDYFKAVNDRYGHPVGDHVLQAIIGVASKRLRRYDSLFRYGGEEFLFCLPKISAEKAVAAMERVRMDIALIPVRLDDGRDVSVTASFGVAEMLPDISIEKNIELADRALFLAKAAGRNCVCAWQE